VALLSVEAVDLWKQVLITAEHRPSPFTCFDAFIHMAPIVTLRGTQQVVDYYKLLVQEMRQRVEDGVSAVPEEKYRLIWDNIPIWYEMRNLGNLFASNKACLVADTYTTAWAVDIKIDEPLTSMADAYTKVYLNISTDLMIEQLLNLMERYDADGLVMHSNRSCKPYSLGQYDLAREVTEKTGKPALIIEADMTDSRVYSEAQVRERVEAFIESLG
jgi:benzoyl-CoA reductase/2-hydroxyglutaryl-CoA dehydratase subunit BcrC/BadD/HgdB